jgi:hypothetical protein
MSCFTKRNTNKKRVIGKLLQLFKNPQKTEKKDEKKNEKKNENIVDPSCKKKAILMGLNYPNSYYELKGCVNDIKNGAQYLKENGFETKLLIDENTSKHYNVLECLNELKHSTSDVVFFHYSGHGSQTKDLNGDEEDKYDEVIFSDDDVQILDDDVNKILLSFPENKTVYLIFDCCHSASIADLHYTLSLNGKVVKVIDKNDIKTKIICISACKDYQTAADVTDNGISYGALSSVLYSILKKCKKNKIELTWRQLYVKLLREMVNKKYNQIPSISSSDPTLFDAKVDFC